MLAKINVVIEQKEHANSLKKMRLWLVLSVPEKRFFELGPLFALFQRDPGEVAT